MKDLSKLDAVKKALEQVVAESTINNGTAGATLMCHYWDQEYAYDETTAQISTDMGKALLSGNLELVKQLQKQLEQVPKSKTILIFKLLKPIPRIQGTKVVYEGEKSFSPAMDNVDILYISEDAVNLGLLEYEETTDKANDKLGRETAIIKLHLKKGIIDVKEAIIDRRGRVVRKARASVTPIAYKAMQVAGKVLWNEKESKRKLFGYDENM